MDASTYQKKSTQFADIKIYTTVVMYLLFLFYFANKYFIKSGAVYLGLLIVALVSFCFTLYLFYLNSSIRDSNYRINVQRILGTLITCLLAIYLTFYSYLANR